MIHHDEHLSIYQGDWVEVLRTIVAGFREVRRVLRKDGTCWLNLGDSYASHDPGGYREGEFLNPDGRPPVKGQARNRAGNYRSGGLKPKDLVGIPWRVAFALQADGWYLRSDVIWSKPNPMPESVTDRPTKAHEYVFLLTRSPRYFYDAEAVREASLPASIERQRYGLAARTPDDGYVASGAFNRTEPYEPNPAGRNLRSVWQIATEPYPGAHFATFPQKLVEPCIKAGTSERGVCPECGAPWVREVERENNWQERKANGGSAGSLTIGHNASHGRGMTHDLDSLRRETTGWRPSCSCPPTGDHQHVYDSVRWSGETLVDIHPTDQSSCRCMEMPPPPIPATVLDPFAGSGTTGLVANRFGRRAILIDLSTDYLDQALTRNQQKPLGLLG